MALRKAAVTGAFYPGDKEELKAMIDEFLKKADDVKIEGKGKVRAILVPHAGYVYSGQIAAHAYKIVQGLDKKAGIKKVIILGPSHTTYITDPVTDSNHEWETPLGTISIFDNDFPESSEAHMEEHCLEVQVPFLQTVFDKFEILPLVVGDAEEKEVAKQIKPLLDDDTLLVISTDLSHFHEYDEAKEMDLKTVKAIEELDSENIGEACGKVPIKTVIELAKQEKWKVKRLAYENSGDVSGDKSRVVGYTSFVFYS